MSGIRNIVVGLGNPGEDYAGTRHNVGWMIIDALAERRGLSGWKEGRLNAALLKSGSLLLTKPLTYMNHSGQAVQQVLRFYKAPPSQLLVVSDDVDLPFGELRFRRSGSSGGQKGLASIIEIVGTNQIPRLRVGIGRPAGRETVTDYVLSAFSPDQQEQLPEVIERAVAELGGHLE